MLRFNTLLLAAYLALSGTTLGAGASAVACVQEEIAGLGYDPGPLDGKGDEYARRSAYEEFQCDHGLEVDGDPGPKTLAKLVEIHGA